MFFRSTVYFPSLSLSTTVLTASTTMSAKYSFELLTCLEIMAVWAMSFSMSLSSMETFLEMFLRTSWALSLASLYPLAMMVGWTLASIRSVAFLRSSPARMTLVVVPSPTSASWVLATSTSILAAGCWTSISFRMVTPSLVMTTSPTESTSILSIPLGPRLLLTASEIALAAEMLLNWASLPFSLFVPSLRMITGALPIPIFLPPNVPLWNTERDYVRTSI